MCRRWMGLIVVIAVVLAGIAPARTAQASDCLTVEDSAACKHGLPADLYAGLLAQMQAQPAPAVGRVGVDQAELIRYSLYQLRRRDVTFYDSPSGTPLETTDPGYAFVVPKSQTPGWVEVEPGKWVSTSALSGTRASSFSGALLSGGLPFPMAWIVRGVKAASIPGGKLLYRNKTLYHHQPVYIYHTVKLGDWEWYLVGPGQWVNQRNVGRFVPIEARHAGRWLAIDLYEQVIAAYEGGTPVMVTLVSSGLPQWPTREGSFQVWASLKVDGMSGAMGKPDQYSIPVVPYVMYFDGERALHGAFWHNGFGYKHSHGCVNLSVSDARWLFGWAAVGTPVYVFSSR